MSKTKKDDGKKREEAATKIQAIFRGKQEHARKPAATADTLHAFATLAVAVAAAEGERNLAATKIQEFIRSKQARTNKSATEPDLHGSDDDERNIIKWILMQLYLFKNKNEKIDTISNLLENTKGSLDEHYEKQFEDYLNKIIQ